MNAKTADGNVHALRGGMMDGGKRVVCGLKGQVHQHAEGTQALVQATPTNEDVTCMACIALMDASDDKPEPLSLAPTPWPVAPREKK